MDNSISLYELSEQIKKENMLLNENEIKNTSEPLNYLKPLERLENNINAIKLLKKIENGYEIKDEDKNILLKYVGFGGISQVFDETNTGKWKEYREFLEQNLTKEEFDNAKESVLTAFYTPKIIIDYMYKGLEKLGFENGNILEPSLGIGNFIGHIPKTMNDSKFYGVELDTISGNIAKILYPNANIKIKGFEDINYNDDFFDIAIGNVPFGEFKVNDRKYNNNFLIHDYFFAKSIDKVRSGGIIAFITSSGTMDKKDEKVRKYIGARCDLLGAIRLPNNIFKGEAGTQVTSDILFFKKKEKIIEEEKDWYQLSIDENGNVYNKYFIDNKDMVIGEIKKVSGRFGYTITCELNDDDVLEDLLNKAINKIQGSIDKKENIKIEDVIALDESDNVKNFSYNIVNEKIYFNENYINIKADINEKEAVIIKDYINMNNCLRDVISSQRENETDEEFKNKQDKLNEVYDNFVEKHNYINSKSNVKLLKKDVNFPLLSSLEDWDGKKFVSKSDIFYKRTIKKSKVIDKVDIPQEALMLSVFTKGCVDLNYMSSLLNNMEEKEIIKNLKGEIFLDVTSTKDIKYVTKDEYLTGNVRKKLEKLQSYISLFDHYNDKVKLKVDKETLYYQEECLMNAIPKDIKASDINIRLGATYIPSEYIKGFIYSLLQTPSYIDIQVEYSTLTDKWNISNKNSDNRNNLATLTYGTKRVNAYKLIEDILNFNDTKIYDKTTDSDGKEISVLNKKETMLASQKKSLIKNEFENWIFKDEIRRKRIETIYNEKFNSIVNRTFDGSNLVFKEMNQDYNLRPHQKNAIARCIFNGNTLLAHVVGAGKTFTMIAAIMESKRMGLCNKALMVVPNHLTEQTSIEFRKIYPFANILVSTKEDFTPQKRKTFISKIATGNYDAIIIAHSQFEKIPMSKEYQTKHIENEIKYCLKYINDNKYNTSKSYSIKQLQLTVKKLGLKLSKLNDDFKKDDIITFEELGIDKLVVDEAHEYKNLFFHTKINNVGGIAKTEALKSSDMFMKCRYIDEITKGKGLIFATGTPISNSMSELYTMQRYLQFDYLKEKGLHNFDSWVSTFGEIENVMEISPEGKYRTKARFSKFFNIPELMSMFREVADIQTDDMLDLPKPKTKFYNISLEPTEEQKEILQEFVNRAHLVKNNSVEPTVDNMLKITNDGKKLALDQRLINPLLPDDEKSKVNQCVNNVYRAWHKTKDKKSTQVIFSDMSTPKSDKSFNIYDDIKDKLINMGVPKEEIAFVHDAKNEVQREELFQKVRNGDIRILLGSTSKLGTGTNIQDKLILIHDLDVPWRPSDLEQRLGRASRQGNENEEVYVYRYITKNTFDAYLWQLIENKQKPISQIMTSKTPLRVIEDVDEVTLSYTEIKAIAMGNPLIKDKLNLEVDLTKLKMLQANHNSNIHTLEDNIKNFYPKEIERLEKNIEYIKDDIKNVMQENEKSEDFCGMQINGVNYTDRSEAAKKLVDIVKEMKISTERKEVGKYKNFDIEVAYDKTFNQYNFYLKRKMTLTGYLNENADNNIKRMDKALDSLNELLTNNINDLDNTKKQLQIAQVEVLKPFEKEEEMKDKLLKLTEINSILNEEDSIKEQKEVSHSKSKVL